MISRSFDTWKEARLSVETELVFGWYEHVITHLLLSLLFLKKTDIASSSKPSTSVNDKTAVLCVCVFVFFRLFAGI